MREIKFRAWNVAHKHFIYPEKDIDTDIIMGLNCKVGYFDSGCIDISWWTTDNHENWILQQYTGLKDKNGKEIYEGDIVNEEMWGNQKVIFKYGCFWAFGHTLLHCPPTVVVGNIHENPELLK